jgi:iron-sulfur cluster repair protein YtfE (RIC family)
MEPQTQTPLADVDAFLAHEHQQLDAILGDVEFLSARRSFATAAKRFGEFRHLLEKHLHAEETMLFPLFVERTKDPQAIIPTLRAQHADLLRLVDHIAAAISQWDHEAFFTQVDALDAALKTHHLDEERLLHPALDALIRSEADWYTLCRKADINY